MTSTICDFAIGILSASIATAIGIVLNYFANQYVSKKKEQKTRMLIANIFILCIDDCLQFVKTTVIYRDLTKWQFLPWTQSQLNIATFFPNHFSSFVQILQSLSYVSSSADVDASCKKLLDLRRKLLLEKNTKHTQQSDQ